MSEEDDVLRTLNELQVQMRDLTRRISELDQRLSIPCLLPADMPAFLPWQGTDARPLKTTHVNEVIVAAPEYLDLEPEDKD